MKNKFIINITTIVLLICLSFSVYAESHTNTVISDGISYSADMTKIISWTENFRGDSFVVPDGVVEICDDAFSGASPVKEITLADSVKKIGKNAFSGSGIETVITSKNSELTEINECAFNDCYAMKVLFLPENLQAIGSNAFKGCTKLDFANIWQKNYHDSSLRHTGDTNGDGEITAKDARTVLRIAAGLESGNVFSELICDMNRDGKITASDARTVLRTAAHLN